jgi:CheY-like chemotaxis protein
MSDLQTATVDSSRFESAAAISLPLVLVADADPASRTRRAEQLRGRGFRVAVARTPFEAIVKASCQLPDLILIDSSLAGSGVDETTELISTCPATAHIPIVRLTAGRRLPPRVFSFARQLS